MFYSECDWLAVILAGAEATNTKLGGLLGTGSEFSYRTGFRLLGMTESLGMTGCCISDVKSARPAFFYPKFNCFFKIMGVRGCLPLSGA